MSVYDVLMERGFIKQMSHEDEIKELNVLLGSIFSLSDQFHFDLLPFFLELRIP